MNAPATAAHLKPYDYKVNHPDNDGVKIVKIYAKLPGYVIYRTESSIRIDIDDAHTEVDKYSANHFKIGVDLARIYSWLPEKLSWSEPINRQIARAMATNALGNYEDAKKMLAHAEERIIKLKVIKGRLQYTSSAFVLVLLVLALSTYHSSSDTSIFYNIALCGSLGGVLSIAIGFSSLEIDIDANQTTNYLIGGSRILIAITAAIFSYFAIKSEIIFSFVGNVPDSYGFYMIAMVSGFTEMLVPNIMSNLVKENTSSKSDTQHEPLT